MILLIARPETNFHLAVHPPTITRILIIITSGLVVFGKVHVRVW